MQIYAADTEKKIDKLDLISNTKVTRFQGTVVSRVNISLN